MPDDERLLSALGKAAREGDPPEEEADVFRPLDEEADERIVERVMATLQSQAPRQPPALTVVTGGARTAPRKRRTLYAAASALAVAAALFLAFRIRPPEPMPGYSMDIAGGEHVIRSPDEPRREIDRFGPGSRIEITLRPVENKVKDPVEARVFLVREGHARSLDAPIEIARGAVRIAGPTEVLFAGVPAGRWEIVIAVGRPGELPGEEAVAAPGNGEGAPFRLLRREILLEHASGAEQP